VTYYEVYERCSYQELPSGRFDVGVYCVEKCIAESIKDLLKQGSKYCASYIDEYVFEDEKAANEYAVKKTLEKLRGIVD